MEITVKLIGMKEGRITEIEFGNQHYYVSSTKRKFEPTKQEILDAVGFDTHYKVWVRKEHVKLIKDILKVQDRTTKFIVRETSLPRHRVQATLHWLKINKEIKDTKVKKGMMHRLVK